MSWSLESYSGRSNMEEVSCADFASFVNDVAFEAIRCSSLRLLVSF